MLNVVKGLPPNFADIVAVFPAAAGIDTIFTYGQTVYVPSGNTLTRALEIHEGVHMAQQSDPESWWKRYLVDPEFRLDQELPAHRAEYRAFKIMYNDRNEQNRYLHAVASRLASPLYGGLLTVSKARKEILK